ncbi:MAG: hypothetical protein ABIO57_00980 [Candidatus Paceibacterota bacterium]
MKNTPESQYLIDSAIKKASIKVNSKVEKIIKLIISVAIGGTIGTLLVECLFNKFIGRLDFGLYFYTMGIIYSLIVMYNVGKIFSTVAKKKKIARKLLKKDLRSIKTKRFQKVQESVLTEVDKEIQEYENAINSIV